MERKNRTRIRRKNAGIKRVFFTLILLCIVIVAFMKIIVPATVTISRYVYRAVRNYYFNSKAFYFNSDKLSEDQAVFEADNWSGADRYAVSINMNSRKNIEEVSKTNINYTIKYTCQVFKNTGEEYKEDVIDFEIAEVKEEDYNPDIGISRTIFADTNTSSFDFAINLKNNVKLNNGDYVYVTIMAESTSPYKKTLSGTFKIIIGNLGMSYQIEDEAYSPYMNVIVTNTLDYYIVDEAFDGYTVGNQISISDYMKLSDENKKKCHSMYIELDFNPEEVVLDTTSMIYLDAEKEGNVAYQVLRDEKGDSYNYVNYVKFKIAAEESKVIKFYKKVSANDYTYPSTNGEPPKVNVKIGEETNG